MERGRLQLSPDEPADLSSQQREMRKAVPPKAPLARIYADPVDDALDHSFPASDPPPWWAR